MAKICEIIALTYNSKNSSEIKKHLTNAHIEKMISTGFNWLISDQKVAVKTYTMETLYIFGKKNKWIHKELQLILEQEISHGSPVYKARGKKILNWLKKEVYN